MDSNLQSYPIRKTGKYTYFFKTEHGDEYKCYFISNAKYFYKYPEIANSFFSFDLELQAVFAKHTGVDKRIPVTVAQVIGEFLSSKINAVLYTCDPSEGKGAARARKFRAWYNYFENYSTSFFRMSVDVNADGMTLFTALLIHKNNKLKDRFIEAYLDFTKDETE